MLRVYLFSIPTIAAYCGHSIAGGAILSYACDRFMAVDGPYKVQINEVANKMILPTWISLICRSAIPPRWWKEALLHAHMYTPVSYTHLRAHETRHDLVCRLLLEK